MALDPWRDWVAAGWTQVKGTPHDTGRCRSCGQLILWVTTPAGKHAPYNRDGISHFATCPDAPRWRKRSTVAGAG